MATFCFQAEHWFSGKLSSCIGSLLGFIEELDRIFHEVYMKLMKLVVTKVKR
jgi:hypothetical protein